MRLLRRLARLATITTLLGDTAALAAATPAARRRPRRTDGSGSPTCLPRRRPAAQVGGRVEAADDPVPAARAAGGAEYLFAEVAGEGPGRAPDAGQGLLVGRPVPGLTCRVSV